jgi:hypothetical protein
MVKVRVRIAKAARPFLADIVPVFAAAVIRFVFVMLWLLRLFVPMLVGAPRSFGRRMPLGVLAVRVEFVGFVKPVEIDLLCH